MANSPNKQSSLRPVQSTGPRLPMAAIMVGVGCLAALAFWLIRARVSKPSQSAQLPESTQLLSNAPNNDSSTDENVPIEVTNEIVAMAPRGKTAVALTRSQPTETRPPALARPEPSP